MDPGPAFPMTIFQEESGVNKNPVVMQETTRPLSLMNGPNPNAAILLEQEIPTGAPVIASENRNGWVRLEVMTEIEESRWNVGWVQEQFVQAKQYTPVVKDHWLETEDGRRYPTIEPHRNNYNHNKKITPRYLVMHATTGTQMSSTINWFRSPHSGVSTHLLIGRDGRVIQFLPFNAMAHHCGDSTWEDQRHKNGRPVRNLNTITIGIELDNAQKLTKSFDGKFRRKKTVVDSDRVRDKKYWKLSGITHWEDFTEVQLEVALDIAKQLVEAYDLKDIIGHDHINLKARVDPGPCFPMQEWQQEIFNRPMPEIRFFVTNDQAEIYEDVDGSVPDLQHALTLAELGKGIKLRIKETRGQWKLVKVKSAKAGKLMNKLGWMRAKDIKSEAEDDSYTTKREGIEFYRHTPNSRLVPPTLKARGSPLPKGMKVRVGRTRGDWKLVVVDDYTWGDTPVEDRRPRWTVGWVLGELVEPFEEG